MKNKIIKKLVGLVCVVLVLFFSISCKENVDLSIYVSGLRVGIYEGVTDEYKITVYSETRESPFLLDGFVGENKNFLTIKLDKETGSCDGVSVLISYDDYSCNGVFDYNPLNGKFTCEIEVPKLPTNSNILATIKSEELEKSCELLTQKQASTIDYKTALNSLKKAEPDLIKELFENTNVATEIHVRLIAEEGKNYYYIGLVQKDGKIKAFLVDGKEGKILAQRTD